MPTEVEDIILSELKEQRADIKCLIKAVAALKVKSGIWGALAGLLPALGIAILWYLAH